jgi:dienelactone hydrolase
MGTRPVFDEWFICFPDDYRWSAAVALLLGSATYGGAEPGEVMAVARALNGRAGDDDAWFRAWCEMGDDLRSASSQYLRACGYYQIGEQFRLPKDDLALSVYQRSVECFREFAALTDGPRIEPAEVPCPGGALPAYLVLPAAANRRCPCVVFFDGLDITKELQFTRGVPELVRRGMACLVIDGPGNGESIRFRGLPLRPDYEVAGSAAVAYLSSRPEISPSGIGVMGISLGGYYAPRCAAREPRFGACVAWGAIWDYQATWRSRIRSQFQQAMSVAGEHICWVLGCGTLDEALARLASFRLDGVVQDMRCPFLLLHGARDEQVPLADAESLFAAVGSADKTLVVFDERSGGATHCQSDRLTAATAVWPDWFAERLTGQAADRASG